MSTHFWHATLSAAAAALVEQSVYAFVHADSSDEEQVFAALLLLQASWLPERMVNTRATRAAHDALRTMGE